MKRDLSYDQFLEKIQTLKAVEDCWTITTTMEIFQGKWTLYVLFQLVKGEEMRFNQLKASIPQNISNIALTKTLKNLCSMGLAERIQYNEVPAHVGYRATQACMDLLPPIYELVRWGYRYLKEDSDDYLCSIVERS